MIDFVGKPLIMKIALCVAMETPKHTISPWIFFEDFFSMKHDTFLILKLLIKFLKELVVGRGLLIAYELQALHKYTHYHDVFGTLYVNK